MSTPSKPPRGAAKTADHRLRVSRSPPHLQDATALGSAPLHAPFLGARSGAPPSSGRAGRRPKARRGMPRTGRAPVPTRARRTAARPAEGARGGAHCSALASWRCVREWASARGTFHVNSVLTNWARHWRLHAAGLHGSNTVRSSSAERGRKTSPFTTGMPPWRTNFVMWRISASSASRGPKHSTPNVGRTTMTRSAPRSLGGGR